MQHLETRNFTHGGHEFELRLFAREHSYLVLAFIGSRQVSPTYSINIDTNLDYFMQYKESFTERLFAIAKSDIEHGMYFKA
jgi:hypothetical protein